MASLFFIKFLLLKIKIFDTIHNINFNIGEMAELVYGTSLEN